MGELNKGIYEFFSTVQAQPVDWLWYPYIPCGKLTLLQGDPGEGKSTFMLNVAALLTQGQDMPDGYKIHSPHTVVYQCAEDNVADTIKPRLLAAGADCDRVAYIIDDYGELTLDPNFQIPSRVTCTDVAPKHSGILRRPRECTKI